MTDHQRTTVVQHSSKAGEWVTASSRPDPRLCGLIRGYEGYVEKRLSFTRRLEVPSGRVPIIFGFGPAFRVSMPHDRSRPSVHHSFVAGMHDAYALVGTDAPADCLEVMLSPIGAHLILGLPMHEIANRTVELRDIFGSEADQIAERLYHAPDWDARFAILNVFFTERLSQARWPAPEVTCLWRTLQRQGGCVNVGRLAATSGWSHRHLIAEFREQIGLPPKMLARILRFSRAVRLLECDAPCGWTAIAQDCGYYDQAHLIRDFRRFAGSTPGAFLRRRIPGGGVIGD